MDKEAHYWIRGKGQTENRTSMGRLNVGIEGDFTGMERRNRRRGDQRPKGEEMVINFLDLDLVRADEAANIAKI